ncbi:MAG: endolytic transglycosylase MltG [Oscillochloridaceae bacterium umkhey_bin13]
MMRHVRALMLGIALLALVVACGSYAILAELRAPAAATGTPVEFVVAPGESTSAIATRLRAEGLIRQPVVFTTMARMQGLDASLQAGKHVLSPTMTMSQILVTLQQSRVEEVQVTLREGMRLEEIAETLAVAGVVRAEPFLVAARDGARFRSEYFLLGSLPEGASLEGYLFPDTYRFTLDDEPAAVIRKLLSRFTEQYATIERNIQVSGVTVHQIVTMASITQRESALEAEMPIIAGVFWNRLKPENAPIVGGGQLGADATVQYALGFSLEEGTWWRKNLTLSDLQVDSPYNTRQRAGLPPGPIAAPGLAALSAAAQPNDDPGYLFFVADCARDGSHNFAVSFDEFLRYEAEWLACQ